MPVVKYLIHQLRYPVGEVLPDWPVVVIVLFLKVVLAYVCNTLEPGNLYVVLLSQIELCSFSSCCLLKRSPKPCFPDVIVALSSANVGSLLPVFLPRRDCSYSSAFAYFTILLVQVTDLYQVVVVCIAVKGSFLYNWYCIVELEDLVVECSNLLSCFIKSSLELPNLVSQSYKALQELVIILLESLVPVLQVSSFNLLQCYTFLYSLLLYNIQYSLLDHSFCKVQLGNVGCFLLGKLPQLFVLTGSEREGRDIVLLRLAISIGFDLPLGSSVNVGCAQANLPCQSLLQSCISGFAFGPCLLRDALYAGFGASAIEQTILVLALYFLVVLFNVLYIRNQGIVLQKVDIVLQPIIVVPKFLRVDYRALDNLYMLVDNVYVLLQQGQLLVAWLLCRLTVLLVVPLLSAIEAGDSGLVLFSIVQSTLDCANVYRPSMRAIDSVLQGTLLALVGLAIGILYAFQALALLALFELPIIDSNSVVYILIKRLSIAVDLDKLVLNVVLEAVIEASLQGVLSLLDSEGKLPKSQGVLDS